MSEENTPVKIKQNQPEIEREYTSAGVKFLNQASAALRYHPKIVEKLRRIQLEAAKLVKL